MYYQRSRWELISLFHWYTQDLIETVQTPMKITIAIKTNTIAAKMADLGTSQDQEPNPEPLG